LVAAVRPKRSDYTDKAVRILTYDPVAKAQIPDQLRGRCDLNERDVTTQWRRLFDGQSITDASLDKAEKLLDSMNPESPLRMRLAAELEEMRQLGKQN
jgi:hypothetical protein